MRDSHHCGREDRRNTAAKKKDGERGKRRSKGRRTQRRADRSLLGSGAGSLLFSSPPIPLLSPSPLLLLGRVSDCF
jgi:hypothetical protein